MPDTMPTLAENIASRAGAKPDGVIRSIQADGSCKEQTFAEAWSRSGPIAAALEANGIGAGYRVVILVRDTLDYAPAFWACLLAGATAVPLSSVATGAPEDELRLILARLGQTAILCDGHTLAVSRVTALIPDAPVVEIGRVDPASFTAARPEAEIPFLVATSGSTGRVKLAAISSKAWLYRAYSQNYSSYGLNSICLGLFPFDSLNGYRALFLSYASWTQLPSHILLSHPAMVLEATERYAATTFQTTNTMAARLAEIEAKAPSNINLRSLKHVGLGGETVMQSVAIAFRDMLARHGAPPNVLGAGYGSTEAGPLLAGIDPTIAPLDDVGSLKLGGCSAGSSIRIVDETGLSLGENHVGNIEVAAPLTMFSSYWGEPEATRDSFTADGWWKTGDLGVITDGSLSLHGRSKEILVIGGRKFSLTEIEAHLQNDPTVQVRTTAVVVRSASSSTDDLGIAFVSGEPAARHGEISYETEIRAAIVRRYGFAPAMIIGIQGSDIPLTATGKVDRFSLARQFAAEQRSSPRKAASIWQDDEKTLRALWCEALDLPHDFDEGATFEDLGGDSIRLATLLTGVRATLGAEIALPEFFAKPTFNTLLALTVHAQRHFDSCSKSDLGLPSNIHRGILHFIEGWFGERVTNDRLLVGRNLTGSLPPLFCVLNTSHAFAHLAEALGADQPIFTFRSAYQVVEPEEDTIQAIALQYVHDIESAVPEGPILLLGQCQGGAIAVAVAQHLLRRRRRVPLLALADWFPEPAFYPEAVVLLYGRESTMNPKLYNIDLAQTIGRGFPEYEYVEVAGGYGELYDKENVGSIASELSRRCAMALRRTPRLLTKSAYNVGLPHVPPRDLDGDRSLPQRSPSASGDSSTALEEAERALELANARIKALESDVATLKKTFSWRLTRPLRWLRSRFPRRN